MGNINAPKIEYFESFASEIISKFQRVKNLVSHRPSSGDYHEEIIKVVLRNFLSKRYSVKKGFLFAGDGKVSNQIDIMIVDENIPAAYIFQEGDFAIVLPEAVVAVIEVKTTLNAPDFVSAVENIASAKKLREFPVTLPGIVFAYDGTKPTDRILDGWFKKQIFLKYKNDSVFTPNTFFFLNHGCLLSRFTREGKWDWGGKYYHKIFRDQSVKNTASDIAWQLSIILAIILSSCEAGQMKITSRFTTSQANKLVQFEGSMKSDVRFAFGEGRS